jgi:hypothetical protein
MRSRIDKKISKTKDIETMGGKDAASTNKPNQSKGRPPPNERSPYSNPCCLDWTPPEPPRGTESILVDYYIQDLAAGVRRENFPREADMGALTLAIGRVLDYPQNTECQNLKLSGLEDFITKHHLDEQAGDPDQGFEAIHPDVAAHARHLASMKTEKKRNRFSAGASSGN